MVGSRVRISATACNIGIKDAKCWFDSSVLVRRFDLDLTNPFERAVGLLVLFLVATHQTYIMGWSEYSNPDTRTITNLGKFILLLFLFVSALPLSLTAFVGLFRIDRKGNC